MSICGKTLKNELWWGLEAWRWMFLAGLVPAVVYGLIALKLPESPRYLVRKGETEKAKRILASITPPDEVERAYKEIHEAIEADEAAKEHGTVRGPWLGLKPIVWVGIALSVTRMFVTEVITEMVKESLSSKPTERQSVVE